jgi:hypothetical protein
MSDEGLINLEDDGPVQPPVSPAPSGEAPPVAAAEQVPAAPPEEPEDAVEVGGQKYVPVGAVIAERKARQALQAKAERVDELEKYARDSQPYVEFLKANPGLISGRQPAAPTPQPEHVDPQTEALAKTLDLYTPEGKPDLARAGTIRQMMTATAQQIAQATIAPIQEESAQTRSARNFQVALQIKDKDGRSPSQAALMQIWRTMPASQTADPNVASILALTALGLDSVHQARPPVASALPPLITEGQGAAPRRASLSSLEQSIARDRGITEAKWAENTKGFAPGKANQLED